MNWVLTLCWFLMFVALGLSLTRLIRGPSLFNSVVAVDFVTSWALGALVLIGFTMQSPWLFQVVPALTLLGFLSVVGIARYFERKNS